MQKEMMLEYPKPVMSRQELHEQMGHSLALLDRAYRVKGQTFAWKTNPSSRGTIEFDTAGLKKWLITQCGI